MCVRFERLMENADKNQAPVTAGSYFGKLLEEVHIGAALGSRLQELTHLVNEHDQPTASAWVPRGDLL